MKNPQPKPSIQCEEKTPWISAGLCLVAAVAIGYSLSTIGRVRVKTEKRTITNTIKASTNGTLICEQDWQVKLAKVDGDWLEISGAGTPGEKRFFITRKGKFSPDGHDGGWDEKVPVTEFWALSKFGNGGTLIVSDGTVNIPSSSVSH